MEEEKIKRQISELTKRVEQVEHQQIMEVKEILSFEDACHFLDLSRSCLYKMVSNKEVPHYKLNGKRVYFEREELKRWLLDTCRVKTMDDYQREAQTIVALNPNN